MTDDTPGLCTTCGLHPPYSDCVHGGCPHSKRRNDGAADYEAKARDAIRRKVLEATPVPLTGTVSIAYGPPMVIDEEATVAAIVVALAQSAADERERCEAIARAEAKRAVGFPRGFYAAENIANAIAALAEPKVGWTKAARSVWYKDASNPNAPEIVDDNLKLNE